MLTVALPISVCRLLPPDHIFTRLTCNHDTTNLHALIAHLSAHDLDHDMQAVLDKLKEFASDFDKLHVEVSFLRALMLIGLAWLLFLFVYGFLSVWMSVRRWRVWTLCRGGCAGGGAKRTKRWIHLYQWTDRWFFVSQATCQVAVVVLYLWSVLVCKSLPTWPSLNFVFMCLFCAYTTGGILWFGWSALLFTWGTSMKGAFLVFLWSVQVWSWSLFQ